MKFKVNISIFAILALLAANSFTAASLSDLAKDDLLQESIKEFHEQAFGQMTEAQKQMMEENAKAIKELKGLTANHCTGGVSASSLSHKEYLEVFAAGPCSPAVFLPGITGSKLIAVIDCKAMKEGAPDVFKDCGWTGCGSFGSPKSEYLIWMPDLFTPMTLVNPSKKNKKCFGGIFGQKVTGTGADIQVRDIPGVRIVPAGASPKTITLAKKGQCGFAGIEDLLPVPGLGYKMWKDMKEVFLSAGFKIGVSVQALPYDYRIDQRNSELNKKFKPIIDTMHALTGKKVTIIAHSYGNFQTANYLWNIPLAERQEKIARFICLGPPFSGSILPIHVVVGMDNSFNQDVFGIKIGLGVDFFKHAVWALKGSYALIAKDIYNIDANEDYMKAIVARAEAEKTGVPQPKGTVMDMFPSPNDECIVGFIDRTNKCVLGMAPLLDYGSINGEHMNYANFPDMLRKYSYEPRSADIYEKEVDVRFNHMENLGVQVNLLYSGARKTVSKIVYDNDPKTKTSKDEIYEPDSTVEIQGDGTVLSTSALTAPIKWADQFNKGVEGAKPVNIIEICGTHQRRDSIFEPGTKQVTKNAYFGIDCNCKNTAEKPVTGEDCGADHGPMIGDPKVISFVLNSVFDGITGAVGPEWKAKTEAELKEFQEKCQLFNP